MVGWAEREGAPSRSSIRNSTNRIELFHSGSCCVHANQLEGYSLPRLSRWAVLMACCRYRHLRRCVWCVLVGGDWKERKGGGGGGERVVGGRKRDRYRTGVLCVC